MKKVFISSVIGGFEEYRDAIDRAIRSLGHSVVRAEDFVASPSAPRVACLQGVQDADLVVLVMGQRYGEVQASGVSATHEEFLEAKSCKETIAFIEKSADPEPKQKDFIQEVQDWQKGLFTESFSGSDELSEKAIKSIHQWEVRAAETKLDAAEIVGRAVAFLPDLRGDPSGCVQDPILIVAICGGPEQSLIRPAEMESADLQKRILLRVLHGDNSVLDVRDGTDSLTRDDCIHFKQNRRSLSIRSDGSILIRAAIPKSSQMMAIIEEDVADLLRKCLHLSNELLGEVDPTERLRELVVACGICGADNRGWRTRSEDERNPSVMQITWNSEHKPVVLSPPVRKRAELRTQTEEIAEDLVVLLRQDFEAHRLVS